MEFARELYRQRQLAQDKYIREVVAELGGKHATRPVSRDQLKRAFAIVDPAIGTWVSHGSVIKRYVSSTRPIFIFCVSPDHIRMERYVRWAFSECEGAGEAWGDARPLPLRAIAARLAAGDVERAGARYRDKRRAHKMI